MTRYRTPTLASLRKMAAEPGSNLAVLATAAPRAVKQPMGQKHWPALKAYRVANPWPGQYVAPWARKAERQAAVIREIEQSPAMLLAHAVLCALDYETRLKVTARLAASAAERPGDPAPLQAFEAAHMTCMNVGEQLDLIRALERPSGH
jgi:hypothetical protein